MKQSGSGIFFDLDGTLVDTALDFFNALNRLLKTYQKPLLPFETVRSMISRGSRAMVQTAFPSVQKDTDLDTLQQEFLLYYAEQLHQHSHLFPGLEALLRWCEEKAIPWGIVTNKTARFTEPLLKTLRLHERSHITVSGDTVAAIKPSPLPLLYACQKVGVLPEKSIYIGDAERDIIAGNHAGMTTLVALYGYLETEDTPDTWGAHAFIHSPQELLEWIIAWHAQ